MKKHLINFNKLLEPVLWTLCTAAILALILTDPIAVAWLLENISVIALWALSVAVCGAISFCAGYVKGKAIGQAAGFQAGENWIKGLYRPYFIKAGVFTNEKN